MFGSNSRHGRSDGGIQEGYRPVLRRLQLEAEEGVDVKAELEAFTVAGLGMPGALVASGSRLHAELMQEHAEAQQDGQGPG